MNRPDQEPNSSTPWSPEFTGTESAIGCPDCESTLSYAMVAQFKIACCPTCQGMLFQRDTLGPAVSRCRHGWKKLDSEIQPLDRSELARKTTCPACREVMETYPYIGPGCVVIDACAKCDLVWLNGGELNRIVQAPGKRDYQAHELERAEITFIKPAVDPSCQPMTHSTGPENDVAGTLIDLIAALGM